MMNKTSKTNKTGVLITGVLIGIAAGIALSLIQDYLKSRDLDKLDRIHIRSRVP